MRLEPRLGWARHCSSLAHLNLDGNFLGVDGVGRLAGGLGQCASLAHLDLARNHIGDDGAGRLADILAGIV